MDSTCAKVDDHCSVITCKKVNVAAEEPVGLRQESKAEEAVAIRAMNEVAIRSFVGGRTISWPAAASPCCIRPDACMRACGGVEDAQTPSSRAAIPAWLPRRWEKLFRGTLSIHPYIYKWVFFYVLDCWSVIVGDHVINQSN